MPFFGKKNKPATVNLPEKTRQSAFGRPDVLGHTYRHIDISKHEVKHQNRDLSVYKPIKIEEYPVTRAWELVKEKVIDTDAILTMGIPELSSLNTEAIDLRLHLRALERAERKLKEMHKVKLLDHYTQKELDLIPDAPYGNSLFNAIKTEQRRLEAMLYNSEFKRKYMEDKLYSEALKEYAIKREKSGAPGPMTEAEIENFKDKFNYVSHSREVNEDRVVELLSPVVDKFPFSYNQDSALDMMRDYAVQLGRDYVEPRKIINVELEKQLMPEGLGAKETLAKRKQIFNEIFRPGGGYPSQTYGKITRKGASRTVEPSRNFVDGSQKAMDVFRRWEARQPPSYNMRKGYTTSALKTDQYTTAMGKERASDAVKTENFKLEIEEVPDQAYITKLQEFVKKTRINKPFSYDVLDEEAAETERFRHSLFDHKLKPKKLTKPPKKSRIEDLAELAKRDEVKQREIITHKVNVDHAEEKILKKTESVPDPYELIYRDLSAFHSIPKVREIDHIISTAMDDLASLSTLPEPAIIRRAHIEKMVKDGESLKVDQTEWSNMISDLEKSAKNIGTVQSQIVDIAKELSASSVEQVNIAIEQTRRDFHRNFESYIERIRNERRLSLNRFLENKRQQKLDEQEGEDDVFVDTDYEVDPKDIPKEYKEYLNGDEIKQTVEFIEQIKDVSEDVFYVMQNDILSRLYRNVESATAALNETLNVVIEPIGENIVLPSNMQDELKIRMSQLRDELYMRATNYQSSAINKSRKILEDFQNDVKTLEERIRVNQELPKKEDLAEILPDDPISIILRRNPNKENVLDEMLKGADHISVEKKIVLPKRKMTRQEIYASEEPLRTKVRDAIQLVYDSYPDENIYISNEKMKFDLSISNEKERALTIKDLKEVEKTPIDISREFHLDKPIVFSDARGNKTTMEGKILKYGRAEELNEAKAFDQLLQHKIVQENIMKKLTGDEIDAVNYALKRMRKHARRIIFGEYGPLRNNVNPYRLGYSRDAMIEAIRNDSKLVYGLDMIAQNKVYGDTLDYFCGLGDTFISNQHKIIREVMKSCASARQVDKDAVPTFKEVGDAIYEFTTITESELLSKIVKEKLSYPVWDYYVENVVNSNMPDIKDFRVRMETYFGEDFLQAHEEEAARQSHVWLDDGYELVKDAIEKNKADAAVGGEEENPYMEPIKENIYDKPWGFKKDLGKRSPWENQDTDHEYDHLGIKRRKILPTSKIDESLTTVTSFESDVSSTFSSSQDEDGYSKVVRPKLKRQDGIDLDDFVLLTKKDDEFDEDLNLSDYEGVESEVEKSIHLKKQISVKNLVEAYQKNIIESRGTANFDNPIYAAEKFNEAIREAGHDVKLPTKKPKKRFAKIKRKLGLDREAKLASKAKKKLTAMKDGTPSITSDFDKIEIKTPTISIGTISTNHLDDTFPRLTQEAATELAKVGVKENLPEITEVTETGPGKRRISIGSLDALEESVVEFLKSYEATDENVLNIEKSFSDAVRTLGSVDGDIEYITRIIAKEKEAIKSFDFLNERNRKIKNELNDLSRKWTNLEYEMNHKRMEVAELEQSFEEFRGMNEEVKQKIDRDGAKVDDLQRRIGVDEISIKRLNNALNTLKDVIDEVGEIAAFRPAELEETAIEKADQSGYYSDLEALTADLSTRPNLDPKVFEQISHRLDPKNGNPLERLHTLYENYEIDLINTDRRIELAKKSLKDNKYLKFRNLSESIARINQDLEVAGNEILKVDAEMHARENILKVSEVMQKQAKTVQDESRETLKKVIEQVQSMEKKQKIISDLSTIYETVDGLEFDEAAVQDTWNALQLISHQADNSGVVSEAYRPDYKKILRKKLMEISEDKATDFFDKVDDAIDLGSKSISILNSTGARLTAEEQVGTIVHNTVNALTREGVITKTEAKEVEDFFAEDMIALTGSAPWGHLRFAKQRPTAKELEWFIQPSEGAILLNPKDPTAKKALEVYKKTSELGKMEFEVETIVNQTGLHPDIVRSAVTEAYRNKLSNKKEVSPEELSMEEGKLSKRLARELIERRMAENNFFSILDKGAVYQEGIQEQSIAIPKKMGFFQPLIDKVKRRGKFSSADGIEEESGISVLTLTPNLEDELTLIGETPKKNPVLSSSINEFMALSDQPIRGPTIHGVDAPEFNFNKLNYLSDGRTGKYMLRNRTKMVENFKDVKMKEQDILNKRIKKLKSAQSRELKRFSKTSNEWVKNYRSQQELESKMKVLKTKARIQESTESLLQGLENTIHSNEFQRKKIIEFLESKISSQAMLLESDKVNGLSNTQLEDFVKENTKIIRDHISAWDPAQDSLGKLTQKKVKELQKKIALNAKKAVKDVTVAAKQVAEDNVTVVIEALKNVKDQFVEHHALQMENAINAADIVKEEINQLKVLRDSARIDEIKWNTYSGKLKKKISAQKVSKIKQAERRAARRYSENQVNKRDALERRAERRKQIEDGLREDDTPEQNFERIQSNIAEDEELFKTFEEVLAEEISKAEAEFVYVPDTLDININLGYSWEESLQRNDKVKAFEKAELSKKKIKLPKPDNMDTLEVLGKPWVDSVIEGIEELADMNAISNSVANLLVKTIQTKIDQGLDLTGEIPFSDYINPQDEIVSGQVMTRERKNEAIEKFKAEIRENASNIKISELMEKNKTDLSYSEMKEVVSEYYNEGTVIFSEENQLVSKAEIRKTLERMEKQRKKDLETEMRLQQEQIDSMLPSGGFDVDHPLFGEDMEEDLNETTIEVHHHMDHKETDNLPENEVLKDKHLTPHKSVEDLPDAPPVPGGDTPPPVIDVDDVDKEQEDEIERKKKEQIDEFDKEHHITDPQAEEPPKPEELPKSDVVPPFRTFPP